MPAERDQRRVPLRSPGPRARFLRGDALAVLATLPSASVHCVVTSPPYWGLRDYRLPPSVWGGAAGCEHAWAARRVEVERGTVGNCAQAENCEGLRSGTSQTRFRGDVRAARARMRWSIATTPRRSKLHSDSRARPPAGWPWSA
jgi:DNA modification methylase